MDKTQKIATCRTQVPSCLSPTKESIEVGQELAYTKIFFDNGEHHLKLIDGKTVPSVFFTWR